ncbi:hypothetical protein [Halopseudomonas aestusnigri]|uniref:hypothetical protein n=1 Tax=Halopseudomonas aestusnigri TaxID=857252 RepID=UPI003001F0C3
MTTTAPARQEVLPRLIRAGAAPGYLGMCRAEFNASARPHLTEIRIGKQGIAFCRYELDAFADEYIQKNLKKKPAREDDSPCSERRGEATWREKPSRASTKGPGSGTSTKSSKVSDFKKALEQAKGKKRSST